MGRRIALVSCASRKAGNASVAEALYTSDLFRKSGALADKRFDSWFILSAKHGLLNPDQRIEPYDETLNRLSVEARKLWAEKVCEQLRGVLLPGDEVSFFAGQRYREFLEPTLRDEGYATSVPMAGLSIGRQLQWLSVQLHETPRLKDLDRLYEQLKRLTVHEGAGRLLGRCSGKMAWPRRGLYFFFEFSERRFLDSGTCRVTRVGTHAVSQGSKSTLWGRLRTHRGGDEGGGNHRGSIFRLHVGAAVRASGRFPDLRTWGLGQSATKEIRTKEEKLEQQVSKYIGKMAVITLGVEDPPGPASDRAYLERNAIALLCGPTGPVDLPSQVWLGRFSDSPEIRNSGLWNKDFVSTQYDPRFLDVFENYVDTALGVRQAPSTSLAPPEWRLMKSVARTTTQLPLVFDDADAE